MTTASRTHTGRLKLEFSGLPNEQGTPMLWFGSWLLGDRGQEGDWFYSGRGGDTLALEAPPGATGIRVRRWISDGLTPEYVDLPLQSENLRTADLDFDSRQPFASLNSTFAGAPPAPKE